MREIHNLQTMTLKFLAPLAAAALLVAPALAHADEVPFHGTYAGTIGGLEAVVADGTGVALHLGKSTVHIDFNLRTDPSACNGIWVTQVWTLTAANGDLLTFENNDESCPTGPYQFHGTGSIDRESCRGTGRFAGASCAGAVDGYADFATGEFIVSFDGVLSVPAKN